MNYEKISKLAEQIFNLCDIAQDTQSGAVERVIKEKVNILYDMVKGE